MRVEISTSGNEVKMFIFRADAHAMGVESLYGCNFIFSEKRFHEIFSLILLKLRLHDLKTIIENLLGTPSLLVSRCFARALNA